MKKYFENLIARKKAELEEAIKRNKEANDVVELRAIGELLMKLKEEIAEAEKQLASLEEPQEEPKEEPQEEGRSFNPIATYTIERKEVEARQDVKSTMEYRTAFMNYVQKGKVSDVLQMRADDQNESGDLGVLLPETIVQEIIKGVEKVYGQLYSRVKKTNIKGGVKYPIGSFSATFSRISETSAPTDRQIGGSVNGYVEFSYKLGEIRIAQTLLANILSVPVFETELAKVIVEAYVKAMDEEILNGDGSNGEMEGILTEANKATGSRIDASHIIEFTAADMADWASWQKKLFAVIPLSMRNLRPEFVLTPHTYEANIKTLKDDNNRPVYSETFNPVDGDEVATFKGRPVCFVEEGLGIENFDDASAGDIFGMYWVGSEAYAINTNLEFAVTRYFDNEKLQYVDRAIVINDGKILDPKYIYILKKAVTA